LLGQFVKLDENIHRKNRDAKVTNKNKTGLYSTLGLKNMFKKCKLFSPELVDSEIFTHYYTSQRKNRGSEHTTTARAF